MFKKMMMLGSLALAAVACVVPASASAQVWNGTHEDSLAGRIDFGNPAVGGTRFGCDVHATFTVTGGTTTGSLESFEPTTETCDGAGTFSGCVLEEHQTTIPRDALGNSLAQIHIVETNVVTLTTPTGNPIVIHNIYDQGCSVEKLIFTVQHLTLTGTNSDLTNVTVSGGALAHTTIRSPTVEITQNVALFTTAGSPMGTATDTITMS